MIRGGGGTGAGGRWLVPGFLALAAMWGSSFLFIKVGIRELHPLHVSLGRVAVGATLMLAALLVTRGRLPRSPRVWLHLTVVGGFGVALPFTLFGYGEQRVSSLLAGVWNATTPLVALPLAVLLFRTERFTVRRLVGIGVGFAGVLVLLGVWQGVGGAALTGQLMCFLASAAYGAQIGYLKRFVANEEISGLALTAVQMIAATGVLAVVAPLAAGLPPAPTGLSAPVLGSVLALGLFGTGLAYLIHLRNIRLVGASAASMVTYLIPVFAVLIGVVVLGERLAWYQPVGAVVVLAGVAIAQGVRMPRSRPPAPVPAPAASRTPAPSP